jgi:peptidoglycan/xylan/chitin deacetylase (PgdA/CDA1 family)
LLFVSITGLAQDIYDSQGAMVQHNVHRNVIYLIFSADEAFEGAPAILSVLEKRHAKASFFLTGNCLRNKAHEEIIKRIIREEHYVGGHSDNHLLYAAWEDRQTLLVTKDSLETDFAKNMAELAKYGIDMDNVRYFLSPYEYYNKATVQWIKDLVQITINYTPGIATAADYTTPDMANYRSSQVLIDSLYAYESKHGLNGCIILIHPGTHPDRTDKLYNRLDEIMEHLEEKGYRFEAL